MDDLYTRDLNAPPIEYDTKKPPLSTFMWRAAVLLNMQNLSNCRRDVGIEYIIYVFICSHVHDWRTIFIPIEDARLPIQICNYASDVGILSFIDCRRIGFQSQIPFRRGCCGRVNRRYEKRVAVYIAPAINKIVVIYPAPGAAVAGALHNAVRDVCFGIFPEMENT